MGIYSKEFERKDPHMQSFRALPWDCSYGSNGILVKRINSLFLEQHKSSVQAFSTNFVLIPCPLKPVFFKSG